MDKDHKVIDRVIDRVVEGWYTITFKGVIALEMGLRGRGKCVYGCRPFVISLSISVFRRGSRRK
jgi:hypothetical protein